MREFCRRPYFNHKNGCPAFGKKQGCPPDAPLFDKYFDIKQEIFAVVNKFNLRKHVERMKEKHPKWSYRQLVCCLYWQPKARKRLEKKIKRIDRKDLVVSRCPEAMGLNVTETLANAGLELEWPPVNIVCQVAVVGNLLNSRERKVYSVSNEEDSE
jgi:predicted metal-binding protein